MTLFKVLDEEDVDTHNSNELAFLQYTSRFVNRNKHKYIRNNPHSSVKCHLQNVRL